MNKEEIEKQLKLSKKQNNNERYDYLCSHFNAINYCIKLEKYTKQLQQANQKLQQRINIAIELNKQVIKDTKDFYRPTKDIIYSGDTLIDIAEQNLEILKGVE